MTEPTTPLTVLAPAPAATTTTTEPLNPMVFFPFAILGFIFAMSGINKSN